MSEFQTRVCGIPCVVRVTTWERYVPEFISGPPDKCYPAEGGCGEWMLLDTRGRPAPWLERKMTEDDREALEQKIFDFMEARDGSANE